MKFTAKTNLNTISSGKTTHTPKQLRDLTRRKETFQTQLSIPACPELLPAQHKSDQCQIFDENFCVAGLRGLGHGDTHCVQVNTLGQYCLGRIRHWCIRDGEGGGGGVGGSGKWESTVRCTN